MLTRLLEGRGMDFLEAVRAVHAEGRLPCCSCAMQQMSFPQTAARMKSCRVIVRMTNQTSPY